jgi:hypothetical protein
MRAWLLRLYPRAWRQRYGAEFAALLEQQPLTPLAVVDVVRGALDARAMAWRLRGGYAAQGQSGQGREPDMKRKAQHRSCSFCGKSNDAVHRLIAGPGLHICDECITLCNKIIAEQEHGTASTPNPNPGSTSRHREIPWWQRLASKRHQVVLRRAMHPESGLLG